MDGTALRLESTEVETTLQGFGFDMTDFPDWIESAVMVDPVQEMLEEFLEESIPSLLVPEIVDAFEALALQESVSFRQVPIDLTANPASFEVSRAGVDLSFDVAVLGSGGVYEPPYGPLMAPVSTKSLAQEKPLAIAIHDDVFNSALYELWRAGAFDMQLSTVDDSLTSIASTLLESDEVVMTMSFLLPPTLVATNDAMVLQFGEVVGNLQTPNGILGETASLAMHGTMAVNPQFGEGELTLDFEDIEATAIVRENDWGLNTLEASAAFSERLPLDMALSMMDALSIAMPSLSELGISQVVVSRSGSAPETVLSLQ
jgi:hypothetical protein